MQINGLCAKYLNGCKSQNDGIFIWLLKSFPSSQSGTCINTTRVVNERKRCAWRADRGDTEQADGLSETQRKRKSNAIPDKSNSLDNYSCQSHSIIRLCASMFVAVNNNGSLLKWNNLAQQIAYATPWQRKKKNKLIFQRMARKCLRKAKIQFKNYFSLANPKASSGFGGKKQVAKMHFCVSNNLSTQKRTKGIKYRCWVSMA